MNLQKIKSNLEEEKTKLISQISYYQNADPYSDKTRDTEVYDDEITEIEEHDRLNATKIELERTLKEVEEALVRIEKGTFGKCESCGKEISEERLEIMPTAKLCSTCQSSKKGA